MQFSSSFKETIWLLFNIMNRYLFLVNCSKKTRMNRWEQYSSSYHCCLGCLFNSLLFSVPKWVFLDPQILWPHWLQRRNRWRIISSNKVVYLQFYTIFSEEPKPLMENIDLNISMYVVECELGPYLLCENRHDGPLSLLNDYQLVIEASARSNGLFRLIWH